MIRLMEMVKYRHIRPFTKVEMNHITDEYLNNNNFPIDLNQKIGFQANRNLV